MGIKVNGLKRFKSIENGKAADGGGNAGSGTA